MNWPPDQPQRLKICETATLFPQPVSEAASLSREAKQEALEATVKLSQGELAAETGEFDDAGRLYEEALARFRSANDARGAARTVTAQGHLALLRRAYEPARQTFEEARELFARENDRFGEGCAFLGLAEAYVRLSKT